MSLSRLLAALAAVALLWAPLALQSGAAMAMAPADHHEQMMEKGSCHEEEPADQDSQANDHACCIALCMAIGAPPLLALEHAPLLGTTTRAVLADDGPSYLAELPTPPPRRS